MMRGRFLIHVMLLVHGLLASGAFAQTRCPVGTLPGNIKCLPDDVGVGEREASRPTGEWIKTWGALASSPETGDSAASVGKLSRDDAESEALTTCSRNGAEDCRVDFVYRNQCVAVVSVRGGAERKFKGRKRKK